MLSQLLISSLAFQPSPSAVPRIGVPSSRAAGPLLAAAEEPPLEPKRPSLAGEKFAVAAIATAIGYTIGSAGLTPAQLWAGPGAIASNPVFQKAAKRAIGGGLGGAIAGVVQVLTLMWLRTTMNYQYRYGTGTRAAMKALYAQGGIRRFYQGVGFAIFQTPLSRFGDTAANTGVLELLALTTWGMNLPIAYKTAMASAAGSLWRVGITPLDTLKTTLQADPILHPLPSRPIPSHHVRLPSRRSCPFYQLPHRTTSRPAPAHPAPPNSRSTVPLPTSSLAKR